MNTLDPHDPDRSTQLDYVSTELISRTSLLTRLTVRQVTVRLSRAEAGVLSALNQSPRRITELAELEGLAQPSVTLMVRRLEEDGLVARGRDAEDGRVVMVSLTAAGAQALEDFRAQARVVLREYLTRMSDAQVDALAAAADALGELIEVIRQGAR